MLQTVMFSMNLILKSLMNQFNNTINWIKLLASPYGNAITYNYANFNYTECINKLNSHAVFTN